MKRAVRGTVAVLLTAVAVPAAAQTPGDVGGQIAQIAEAMITKDPTPLLIDVGLSYTDVSGNAESDTGAASALVFRDWETWSLGFYGTAARHATADQVADERYSAAVAGARPLGRRFKGVLLAQWNRAPLTGLANQTVLGGVLLWVPPTPRRLELGVFGGGGWATESFTVDFPAQDFALAIGGFHGKYWFHPTTNLGLLFTHYLDLTNTANHQTSGTASLTAVVNKIVSVEFSYSVRYDREPVIGKETTDSIAAVSLHLSYSRAKKPAAPQP